MCSKGSQWVKAALCNPVVLRGLHRPLPRRLADLLSPPPTSQVLSKSFWHLHMPFIPCAPSLCSWHSSASQLNCPDFTEAFPDHIIVRSSSIFYRYTIFPTFLLRGILHFVTVYLLLSTNLCNSAIKCLLVDAQLYLLNGDKYFLSEGVNYWMCSVIFRF